MEKAKPQIDPEFETLIPAPLEEELARLKSALDEGGCRDPLVVWKGHGILLDGHNRFRHCEAAGIPYGVVFLDLPDREAAMRWIVTNQLARRNLTDFQRAELALRLKKSLSVKAQQHQQAGVSLKPSEAPIDSRKTAAISAGVSPTTLSKVQKIVEKGSPELVSAVRSGAMSIHKGAKLAGGDQIVQEEERLARARVKAAPPADAMGTSLPNDSVIQAFGAGQAFDKLLKPACAVILDALSSLEFSPAGRFITRFKREAFRAQVEGLIADAKPYAVCPRCKGAGCTDCRDSGWTPRSLYDALTSSLLRT